MRWISDHFGDHHKPWLARKHWRERRIVSHGVRGCFFALAIPFFGLPALLSFTAALYHLFQNHRIVWGALFTGTLFGSALAGVIYHWLHWRKFGKSICYLETLPGVIGGWFKAVVEVNMSGHLPPSALLSLENFKFEGGQPLFKLTAWETSERVLPSRFRHIKGNRYQIQVRFQIPPRKDYYANWGLTLKAEIPGVNISAYFDVPIFETDEASFVEKTPF